MCPSKFHVSVLKSYWLCLCVCVCELMLLKPWGCVWSFWMIIFEWGFVCIMYVYFCFCLLDTENTFAYICVHSHNSVFTVNFSYLTTYLSIICSLSKSEAVWLLCIRLYLQYQFFIIFFFLTIARTHFSTLG